MDRKELLKLIENADTALDLSDKGIKSLPPEIGSLKNLELLDLRNNQLVSLPPEIGNLTNLEELSLSENQLATLPPEIGNLTNITKLNLSSNKLATLPPEICNLKDLEDLSLGDNQLSTLPPEICNLTKLKELFLSVNQLSTLPSKICYLKELKKLYLYNNLLASLPTEICNLKNLVHLDLGNNQLASLPPEIGSLTILTALLLDNNQLGLLPPEFANLTKLGILYLQNNDLESLPTEIGKLKNLRELDLGGNENLKFPPPEIVSQGTEAILAFLQKKLAEKEGRGEKFVKQWVSKALLVGEGGVGKTSLLNVLRGGECVAGEDKTVGVDIKSLDLRHPAEKDVTMKLNVWDFGGQDIYHATHQFFFSRRSLFILLWNSRLGYKQGKLNDWLERIHSKAPGSPVIVVATHIDEHEPDLPVRELKEAFGQVVECYSISNTKKEGVEELLEKIRETAAELPLMGEEWPGEWLRAAEKVRSLEKNYISPREFNEILIENGVPEKDIQMLARCMHDLGDILFFMDIEELKNIVILKPKWVSEYICKVLDSPAVKDAKGVLTQAHMEELWHDLDVTMQYHFLRLMEQFDLAYETRQPKDSSLVVECLPLDQPKNLNERWEKLKEPDGIKEITMRYELSSLQPGIPTYSIARLHRFSTYCHWRRGAIFADGRDRKHVALLKSEEWEKQLVLSAIGPLPYSFFNLLRDGLELTLARFPGLKIDRYIPCPCGGGEGGKCSHEFKLEHLEKVAIKGAHGLQCPESLEMVPVSKALYGIHSSAEAYMQKAIEEMRADHNKNIGYLVELIQREFMKLFDRDKNNVESHCPGVFTLRPKGAGKWLGKISGRKMLLQLYCEQPGCWHPVGDPYEIDEPADWLKSIAPHINNIFSKLKIAGPAASVFLGPRFKQVEEAINEDIALMGEMVELLPDISDEKHHFADPMGKGRLEGSQLRVLHSLLLKIDPSKRWGGLKKVLTPEGLYLWLCEDHAREYKETPDRGEDILDPVD